MSIKRVIESREIEFFLISDKTYPIPGNRSAPGVGRRYVEFDDNHCDVVRDRSHGFERETERKKSVAFSECTNKPTFNSNADTTSATKPLTGEPYTDETHQYANNSLKTCIGEYDALD